MDAGSGAHQSVPKEMVLSLKEIGLPIIIGPNYSKFIEVKELVDKEACFSVNNSQKLSVLLSSFFIDKSSHATNGFIVIV